LHAEVIDRVVAVVNDDIVMLSEVDATLSEALAAGIDVTQKETLDGLINRVLLLNEARKIKRKHIFSAQTRKDDDVLINEYIVNRLKAFIRIPYDEIELFYQDNIEFFSPRSKETESESLEDFYEVRDDIEEYLVQIELNRRIEKHIDELRSKAYIRIQLN
jgi:hypothetical protein